MSDFGDSPRASGGVNDDSFINRIPENKRKYLVYGAIVAILIGIALTIAGSVMLGVGVSKSNQQPVCPSIAASPVYATVLSTKISYQDVQNNYQSAADIVRQQIRSLVSGTSGSALFAADAANTDPVITILGLSPGPNNGVMVVSGLAYTTQDAPPLSTLENSLSSSPDLTLYHASAQSSTSSTQQMCSAVNQYTDKFTTQPNSPSSTTGRPEPGSTVTNGAPTQSSPTTVSHGITTQKQTTGPVNTQKAGTTTTVPGTINTTTSASTSHTPTSTTISTTASKHTSASSTQTIGTSASSTTSTNTNAMPSQSTSTSGTTTMSKHTTASLSQSTTGNAGTTTSTNMKTSSTQSTSPTTSIPSTQPSGCFTTPQSSPTAGTQSTTIGSQTTSLPPTNQRDIVVLIDDSTSVGTSANYKQITNWLTTQMFPEWPVDGGDWEVAPVQYAMNEYNILMDFDQTSVSELIEVVNVTVYSGRNQPSIKKALKSSLGLPGRSDAPRITILITASSNVRDIEAASPFAKQLGKVGQLVTLAVGGADEQLVGLLSSDPMYSFSSPTFSPTAQLAQQITQIIAGGISQTTTPAQSSSTTAPQLVDFPCHPDVAIIFDQSKAVGSQDEYAKQMSFISQQLVPSWPIARSLPFMEAEVVDYNSVEGGFMGPLGYNYKDAAQLSTMINVYNYNYDHVASPSISGALQFLAQNVSNRRPGRQPTTLLFTYSSDYTDVVAAIPTAAALGNVVIVGMGNVSASYLSALTGDVITNTTYGQKMVATINTMLCSPSPAVPLPTTTLPSSTSQPPMTTTVSPSTTHSTISPSSCPDCYPEESNILIIMDASIAMTDYMFSRQQYFISNDLTPGWTHLDRVALLAFDDEKHFQQMVDFGDLQSLKELNLLVNNTVKMHYPPSLTSAFKHALNGYHPLAKYGTMHTIMFTSTSNQTEIQNAAPYAKQLQAKGSVTIIGLDMSDVSGLSSLSSPSGAISWPEMSNDTGIAQQIEKHLNPTVVATTGTPSFTMSTTPSMTSQTVATPTITTPSAHTSTTSGTTQSGSSPSKTTQGKTTAQQTTSSGTTPSNPSTRAGSTTSAHSTNSPTTSSGTTSQSTTAPLPCSRDVILLLDESNDIPDAISFGKLKSWLMNSLVPLWPVNPLSIAVAPFGYANKTFDDIGGDFTEKNVEEVQILLNNNYNWKSDTSQGLVRALRTASAISTPRPGPATIIISASDAQADITAATPYAMKLKQNSGTVITLAIGPATTGNLGKLSSGQNFTFKSASFDISQSIAMQITQALCPATQSTTVASTTSSTFVPTTSVPNIFPCNPDAAILIDNSGEQQSESQFHDLVHYIGDSLVSNWPIGHTETESVVIAANAVIGHTAPGAWSYSSEKGLQLAIDGMDEEYFGGKGSITKMLLYLQTSVKDRRQAAPLSAVIFTYTSTASDVYSALPIAQQLNANLIFVCLGDSTDPQLLGLLSGHVITGLGQGPQLTDAINNVMCSPTSPLYTPTNSPPTAPTTQQATTTTASPPTTTSQKTTTVSPSMCPDCYPEQSNILIVMDASSSMTDYMFSRQQYFISNDLTPGWTHLDRVALLAFDDEKHFQQMVDFGDLNSLSELNILVNNTVKMANPPSLTSAFKHALNFHPLAKYGQMQTILLTSTTNATDVQSAQPYAQLLQAKGLVTIIGLDMSDVSGLSSLSSPSGAISWPEMSNDTGIAQQIEKHLNPSGVVTTGTPSSSMGTSSGSSVADTTPSQMTTTSTTSLKSTTTGGQTTSSLPSHTTQGVQTTTSTPQQTSTTGSSSSSSAGTTTNPAATPYPLRCTRDVLILVDVSNAIPDSGSFEKLKSWLTYSLIPLWSVPMNMKVAPFGYANETWNDVGGDFAETSVEEVQILLKYNLRYEPNMGPAITKALKKASAVAAPITAPITILISARDAPSDVMSAMPYATKLKQMSGTFITLAIGPNTTGNLSMLASGPKFVFSSPSFDIDADMATSITKALCTSVPYPTAGTTTVGTTLHPTTSMPNIFSCNPDAAILIDNSATQQTESQYHDLVHYIGDSLVSNWPIGPDRTEAAVVVANAVIGQAANGEWSYQTTSDLKTAIDAMDGEYYGGLGSITGMLSYLQSILPKRRQTAPLSVVIFTHSSTSSDVYSALPIAQELNANLIIVGLGNTVDAHLLGLLSGHVITGVQLGPQLGDMIDAAMCSPASAAYTPTLSPPTTLKTTGVPTHSSTQSVTTTTAASTASAASCPDCYPDQSNILLLLDVSSGQDPTTLAQQKTVVDKLVQYWNHLERVSVATYSNVLVESLAYQDLSSNETATLEKVIANIDQSSHPANIAHSLKMATGIAPFAEFGGQHVVFFSTTSNATDVTKSLPFAVELQRKGAMTVVGVGMANMTLLTPLGSEGEVIAWTDTRDTDTVVTQIMQTLTSKPITKRSTSPSTTSGTTLSQTTTTNGVQSSTTGPVADVFIPSKSNVVILMDGSETAKNYIDAQKKLVESLVETWTHFERVAIEEYYSSTNVITVYGDLVKGAQDVTNYMKAFNYMGGVANMTNVLKRVSDVYPLQDGYNTRNIILLTSSDDPADVTSSLPYATSLKTQGRISLISMGIDDSNEVSQLANPGCFSKWNGTASITSITQTVMNCFDHVTSL